MLKVEGIFDIISYFILYDIYNTYIYINICHAVYYYINVGVACCGFLSQHRILLKKKVHENPFQLAGEKVLEVCPMS